MSEGVKRINELLIDFYGKDVVLDKPKFRIVWTSSQFEHRYEEFEVFTELGGIYLRTEKGVFELPKYGNEFQQNKWVLERLVATKGNPHLELVTPWSYEPVWIFGCGNSDPQPIWRAVKLMIDDILTRKVQFLTRKDIERLDAEKMAKEKERDLMYIKNEGHAFDGHLVNGSGIIVPQNYEKKVS